VKPAPLAVPGGCPLANRKSAKQTAGASVAI
jgi:hypothetical protein